jgi:alpha-L-rhamnosidase
MSLRAYGLQCEHRVTPLGVDEPRPLFGWKLSSDVAGQGQRSYRLRVRALGATDPIWDSGWVESDMHYGVVYAGTPVLATTRYRWQVEVKAAADSEAAESESWFETGLLTPAAWTARWLRRDPRSGGAVDPPEGGEAPGRAGRLKPPGQFRKELTLTSPPLRARVYATARGIYHLRVNGTRVGRDELTPGWTDYRYRLQYQVYDITDLLVAGPNVVGAVVADGWWCGYVGFEPQRPAQHYGRFPELLVQVHVDCEDGTSLVVGSDDTWRESPGHVVYADLLVGEAHDLRRATPGWDRPGFDDSSWSPARASDVGVVPLVAQIDEPVRVTREIAAQTVTAVASGYLVDFGQNLVGWVRLGVKDAPAGTRIRLRHGETLDQGQLYTANLRSAEATDVLMVSGAGGQEWFEPSFTTHGFRYVEVTGYPGDLHTGDLTAIVVQSDTPPVGDLHCSDPMIEQLISNISWGQRGNYVSVPTDCPQRDERLGWTADAQIFLPTACFNADVAAFMGRWTLDLIDEQDDDGAFTDYVPDISMDHEGAPAWGDAGVIVPYHLWRVYGDERLLERSYPSMRAWVDHIHRHNPSLLWTRATGNGYGDWLQIDADTPREVVATAYFARSASLVAEAAAALGRVEDAARYGTLADRIRAAFATEFVGADGKVATGTQTAYLMGLAWDLIPSSLRPASFGHLCDDIEVRGRRLTTGFVGVPLICPLLTAWGRPDLAFALLHQEEFPSWGYSIRRGATTIWERWDGWTEERGFQSVNMNSFNHYSLGSVGEWLWRSVAGIDQAPGSLAYRDLVIEPHFGSRLQWVTARFDSPRGLIEVRWQQRDRDVDIDVEIPPGRPAEVRLGAASDADIAIDGAALSTHPSAHLVSTGAGRICFTLIPGSWHITARGAGTHEA